MIMLRTSRAPLRLGLAFPTLVIVVSIICATLSTTARAQGFFVTVTDLPLMASLTEQTDQALFYDKPAGRIVEVMAEGTATRQKAIAFYADTLPQLGWSSVGDGFERNGERLKISYEQMGNKLIVRISINPK